jgi:hypothetical protein
MRGWYDGARPDNPECLRLAGAFPISHGFGRWPEFSEKPLSTIGCAASSPAPTSPAWLAQNLLLLPLFIIYADCLEHHCRLSLTSLTTSSVPSFISCVPTFTVQNLTDTRNIDIFGQSNPCLPVLLGLSGGRCGSANSAQRLLAPVQIARTPSFTEGTL